jgi:hypothetical protein
MVEKSCQAAKRSSPFTEISTHFNTKANQLQELGEIVEQAHKRIFGETPPSNQKTGQDCVEPACEWDELTISGERLDKNFEYLSDSVNNLLQRL